MIRILQLLEFHADFENESIADVLRDGLGGDYQVDRHRIRDNPAGMISAIARLRKIRKNYDVAHAFSSRALMAAAALDVRIIYSPARFPTATDARWLGVIMSIRDVHVVCPTQRMRHAFISHGLKAWRCHFVPPSVVSKPGRCGRDELRALLGFALVEHVMLPCGESTHSAGHDLALWTTSILHELDPKFRFLIWGRGSCAVTLANLNAKGLRPKLLVNAEHKLRRKVGFEELITAADSVIVTASGPVSTLPLRIAMACGVPIIATDSSTVREMLGAHPAATIVDSGKPRVLAQRILDLIDSTGARPNTSDAARTKAVTLLPPVTMLRRYREVFAEATVIDTCPFIGGSAGAGARIV